MAYKKPKSISQTRIKSAIVLLSISDLTVSIQSALAKNEDLEVLRELCSAGVPPLVRGDLWRSFLGVHRRPDAIGSWNGPLDCENQSLIHQDTISQASMHH